MGEILFLAHRVPFPPNRGDKIRAHHLLRKLAQMAPLHVGCFAETDEDLAAEHELAAIAKTHALITRSKPLALAGVEAVLSGKPVSLTAFHSGRLEAWIQHTLASQAIDTIVIFSGQMGQYVPLEFDGQVIVDLCDVDSAKFEGYADAGQRVWLNAREARLLMIEEERLGKRADVTILISDSEAVLYRSRLIDADGINVQVLGNGIDAEFFGSSPISAREPVLPAPGPHFVFTGQMDYRPNEQAALWVADEFMPAIRKRHPGAEFHVVGRNPTAKLLGRQGVSGVTITGEVPDVRPYLAAADCVIAPLMIARGVQNKVLEAMAMKCPVLLTPQAANGIDAVHGRHWMIAEADKQSMCEAANALLNDDAMCRKMGEAAREFVLDHHAWDAMLAPLDELVGFDRQVSHVA